ncbi:MAG TPA: VIT domain-containing protein [Polyangiaceae bacterium]
MRLALLKWLLLPLWLSVLLVQAEYARAAAPDASDAEKTLSPYFAVENADPAVDRLPLASTRVEVAVADVVAEVSVTQVYENRGTRPINAKYVFPASTRAAVHGMRMTVKNQVIEAKIHEREQAKKIFEQAKQSGKSATLLEEQRPNVFTMNVANVMPGDRIEVALRYTELLVPSEGVYEFTFPTVVGPRYSNQNAAEAPATDRFVASPYLKQGQAPPSTLEISGTLASGIPLAAVESPSHALTKSFDNASLARFSLPAAEARGGDRDFVLRYRLAGNAVQSGLSLFERGNEKFFLLQVQPPERVSDAEIPPREYVFIVDVSGSMSGFPLDTTKLLMKDLFSGLRPSDQFNVLLFSGGSRVLAPKSLPATKENVARALRALSEEQGGGATELLPALEHALQLSPAPGRSRSFVIVTDGYVDADRRALEFVRNHLGEANAFSFGIGSSVNRYLIEGLARAGSGEPFIVTKPEEAKATAARLREYVRAPVLTNVRVAYEGFDAYDVEPRAVPDVLAERPVVVFGKYRGAPAGAITLTGVGGKGPYTQRFEVARSTPRPENAALPYLWARTRIATLGDFAFGEPDDALRKQIVGLGLSYNLLTQYTSFVAVAHTIRNPGAPATDVDQPLPLPAGVSNSAVGEPFTSADEPELALLAALLALFGAFAAVARSRRASTVGA